LDLLLQEKKNLHAYLKVYERDFNRSHGRPVMKNEDILPVANEYQRYKVCLFSPIYFLFSPLIEMMF
jgi:hypothetical protein